MFKIGGPYPLFLGKKDINSGNVEKREKREKRVYIKTA